jgi:hypothetical protein
MDCVNIVDGLVRGSAMQKGAGFSGPIGRKCSLTDRIGNFVVSYKLTADTRRRGWCFRFKLSSFTRAPPLARKAASLIEKETDERPTSNVQHRTSNKCILSVLKKISRSDSNLRHSSFVIRYPAVRCLIQAIVAGSLIIRKTVPFWCSFIRGFKSSQVGETAGLQ